ncbi:MAG: helicase [Gammaproteobacteria bacterium]|nr:helicase [Gammaproteobacteria bacterium]
MRQQLIGPAGEGEIGVSPLARYPTGVLYPVEPDESGRDPALIDSTEDGGLLDEDAEPDETGEDDGPARARPGRRRRYVPPSSVGFSFFVRGEAQLSITASAATYRASEERDATGQFRPGRFERIPLEEHTWTWSKAAPPEESIWQGRGGIDVRMREYRSGAIITVTLVNRNEVDDVAPRRRQAERVGKSLFEARIECIVESGDLAEYPRVDPSLLTEEEQELELQYRHQRIYAVGHGAAVDWDVPANGMPRIRSQFMPCVEVPITTNEFRERDGDYDVLEFRCLAEATRIEDLEQFVAGYRAWVAGQQRTAAGLDHELERTAAGRICDRMEKALARMAGSVSLLRENPRAAESFRLANRAMRQQMLRPRPASGNEADTEPRWRPFQLAFLLTVMESAIREEDEFRDVLDLIWFPTGGGKTEAYLGLIAFLIVWRRLQYPGSGGGTVAFMRYTLRLLTRQQFERAARMICALELMRRNDPRRLGDEPIRVGMWVGASVSPNRFKEAAQRVREIAAGSTDARHALVMDGCPWCGTAFDSLHGYRATADEFGFRCVNPDCEFGRCSEPLPCNVVDEALYESPPSLLIATLDKFARVPWEDRAGSFFGVGPGNHSRPPELVIQDELHLVTGPLGSIAGLYEAGFDTLLAQRVRPKYIASTATIRMAEEQVRRMYGRELAVFPPPGLSCDDSYFAHTDRTRAGRAYVGYFAPLLDQQHCLAPLAAALLAAPAVLFEGQTDQEALVDAWWTQVLYHGSLRGVGNSHNAFLTDVRDFGRMLGASDQSGAANGDVARFQNPRIEQLTSMQAAEKNAETFHRLAMPRTESESLDAVLATNMVSVGLDVARLALMAVNGQPLTTAEYIQATSRVGRADVPGVIFANYYRHQARSVSHFESFRSYHESFYRFVEPSSVTPQTYQVRARALHAALVVAVRHACADLRGNESAGLFDRNAPDVRKVIADFKRRCANAVDSEQLPDLAAHVDSLVDEWHDEAFRCKADKRALHYRAPPRERNAERLLYGHGDTHRSGLWMTLQSMRNVESEGVLRMHG